MKKKIENKTIKYLLIFISVALSSLLILIIASQYIKFKNLSTLDNKLNSYEESLFNLYNYEDYDSYGGETPKETLSLYIEAVKSEDYELASKYLIKDKREEELKSLGISSRDKIDKMIDVLIGSLESDGYFYENKKAFLIRKPILIDFIMQSNGIWKIRSF